MFGGLDLKGTSKAKEDPPKKEDEKPKGNGSAAETSAFSFLTSLTTAAPPTTTTTPAAVGGSSSSTFAFLNNTTASASAAPASVVVEAAKNGNDDKEGGPTGLISPAVGSAFGFMATPTMSTAAVELPAPATIPATIMGAPPPPSSSSSSSTFDFLQQKAPERESNLASEDLLSSVMAHGQPPQPAGSGLVFATTAKKKAAVKKRSRTAKIGAGATPGAAAAAPMSLPPPSAMLPAPPATAGGLASSSSVSLSRSVSDDSSKLVEAASEASRRAEEFIHSKFQAAETVVPPELQTVRSEDDDVIIAAKAAAAEAKQLQQKKTPSFSNLFRGRSPTPKPVAASTSTGKPPAAAASMVGVPSGVDRLQKEQEEAKRAMAERQLKMLNSAKAADTMSSTSTFQPPAVALSSSRSLAAPAAAPKVSSTTAAAAAAHPLPQSSFGLPDVLSMHHQPQTPTDKLNQILLDFETQVTANMDQLTRLNAQKRGVLAEQTVVTGRMQMAYSDAENCQNQQAAAAEAEDFDTAAQLAEMIQEYEQEQTRCKGELDAIAATVGQIDGQVVMTTSNIEKLFQGLQGKLQALKEAQDDDTDAAVSLERFSLIAKQLSTENERLQQDFKHLMRDSELVAEERNELEKAISEQSGEYEKLRDQARSQLQETEAAIEELRKALDAKQREAARLRTEAAGHDESVLRVRVKFARQINRVQKKEMTIQDNKDEWESEKRSYDLQKEAHDATVQAHSEALLARDMLADNVKKQIAYSETCGSIVASEIKSLTLEKSVAADPALQAEVVQCQGNVRKHQVEFDSAKAVVASLEREIEFLVNDIPVFEETKKVAAARRDFKAASKASKDIKDATARLGLAQSELQGEATDRLNAAEAELVVAKEKLQSAQEMALAQEKECVIGIMVEWAETLKRLSTAVKELEDGMGVHAATKYCLKAQMKALRSQGEAYGAKYGGWHELLVDFEAIDEEPAESCNGYRDRSFGVVGSEEASRERVLHTETDEEEDCPDVASMERMRQFLSATAQLREVEQALEEAAAAEDYEKAAVLDERLQELLVLVEGLNLSDAEMEQALALELTATSQDDIDQEMDYPMSPQNSEPNADIARSESNGQLSAEPDTIGTSSSVGTDVGVDDEGEGADGQATSIAADDAIVLDELVTPAAAADDADVLNGELPQEDANGLEKSRNDNDDAAEEVDPEKDAIEGEDNDDDVEEVDPKKDAIECEAPNSKGSEDE